MDRTSGPPPLGWPDGRWSARWIWSEPAPIGIGSAILPTLDDDAAAGLVAMRRELTLATVPDTAPARVTADSRYALWVNGTEVSRGPIRAPSRRLHYDDVDLAPWLHAGANVIAALVRRYPGPTPWWMPARPTFGLGGGAFLFEARLATDGGATASVGSDRAWRVLALDGWTQIVPKGIAGHALDLIDARSIPAGWTEWGFDDSTWMAAVELATNHVGWDGDHRPPSDPYGPLLPRPIAQLGGAVRRGRPLAVGTAPGSEPGADPSRQVGADLAASTDLVRVELAAAGSPATPAPILDTELDQGVASVVVIDLGEETAGLLSLEVVAPEGTVFDAQAAEAVDDAGHLVPLQQHNGFRYIARGHDDRFDAFDPLGLRYLGLSIRGHGRIAVNEVSMREQLHPRPEGPTFACSDPQLEQIWAIGRRTVDLNAQDAYLDCPSREQRAWTGDSVVHQMVDLTTNPDWSLARWNACLSASPRSDGMLPMSAGGDIEWADAAYIPDWALHWVHALHNLWRYTGDRDLIASLLGAAEGVLRWFAPFQGADGLLRDVTGWIIIDWSAVTTTGASGALNALWLRALGEFAEMADALGDGGRAAWARARWFEGASGFEGFWDDQRQVYVDHIVDGVRGRPVSQHTIAAALATPGLVPSWRVADLADALCDRSRLVFAAWLMPGIDARLDGDDVDEGDMYAGASYLLAGKAEPWWDVERQIVAAQPFFRYVVHDAVVAAGRADRIPDLCRDWAVLLERDGVAQTTWSEVWYGGTHCHGWSSTPTRDLMQHTLGITPAEPGFTVASVAPALGDLEWASGSVPTPHGPVSVQIDRDGLTVTSPVPTRVQLDGTTTEHPPGTFYSARD